MDDLHKRHIDKRFLAIEEDWEVQKFEKDVKAKEPSATSDPHGVTGMRKNSSYEPSARADYELRNREIVANRT